MLKRTLGCLVLLAALGAVPVEAATGHWWAGGGIGLAFGSDTKFVSLEPVVGYDFTERFGVGARVIFSYRSDDRYYEGFSTTDYGASLFARYFLTKQIFLQGEYEYLSYEFPTTAGESDREGFGSLLGGAGFAQPMGDNARFFLLGLYNFSFDEDELSPYNEAWILRIGVGFHF